MAGDKVASLIVRIGANDQAIQSALASVGAKAKSLDADLKHLGASPLAGGATKSLESLKATMKQITDAQERVAERGRLAAQGLEAMGGASRLTDAQLKQVNRTLQAGLDSYRALGKEAPAEMRRVADSVKSSVAGMAEPMGMIEKKAIALGAAIGTFLGNAALEVGRQFIQAGKRAFDYADSLTNLSATTQITVEGLQRIEALGVTSGVSLEQLAGSVGMLQKNLDNPAAINALGKMGLNYKEIRALKPEDQFIEIASSIAAIQDPVERANAGAALFGRQWQTIAPAIQGNIKEIIASVNTLSKEQIDALDEAGDAWDQFVKDSERGVTRFLGNLVLDAKKAELSLIDLLRPMEAVRKLQQGHFEREADPGFDAALKRVPTAPALPRGAAGVVDGADIGAKALKEFDEAAERAKASAEKFKTIQDQLFGRAIIANAELLVRALGDDENLTQLTAEATKKLHGELGQAIAVYQALGKQVPSQLADIYEKTLRLSNTPIQVKAVGAPSLAGLTKTFIAFGETAADGTVFARDFSNELNAAQIQTDKSGKVLNTVLIPSVARAGVTLEKATTETSAWNSSLFTLAQGFETVAQISDGSFGQIAQDIGRVIGAMQLAGDAGDAMKLGLAQIGEKGQRGAGFSNLAAGALSAVGAIDAATSSTSKLKNALGGAAAGAKAGSAFGPWGTAIGAGVGALVGVFRRNTQGRDAVRDFAKQFDGGFDELHKRLSTLGAEGERMWVSLTQGVGSGNPEQAKKAIGDVTAALDAQKQQFDELQSSIGTAGEKLSGLTTITPDVQAALDAVFDESTTEGYLAKVRELNDELEKQATKYDDVKGALDKYNISTASAGKEFKQQAINRSSQTLLNDFKLLREAGVEINTQMRGMGGNVRAFIKEAQAAGVEVPESMMTVIQSAIDAGEVFDENGKKITDIKDLGLTFGTTMQSTMAKVETSVGRLALVLEGLAKFLGITLPKAAADGADKIDKAFDDLDPVITPRVEWPTSFNPQTGDAVIVPDAAATGARVTPFGLQHLKGGGFARGTDTVPAMLTPGELVINAAQQANLASALNAGAARPTLIIERLEVNGVFSEGDFQTTMVRRVIPALNAAWEDNAGTARTNTQDALGIR